jgi:hypothetical protein
MTTTTSTTQHIELINPASVANLSLRTVAIDGSIAPTARPYLLSNACVALCDTTTFGNVFVSLSPGTYSEGSSVISVIYQYNIIKNTGSGTVTITPVAGYTINGAGSYVLAAGLLLKLILDSAVNNWAILAIGAVVTPGSKIPSIASSTTNAIVRWSGALGDTFNNSLITISGINNITIPVALNITGSLFTGTSALSAATNTVIGTVTGTAPNNTSLLMGANINGVLTTLVGSVIAIADNNAGNRLAALADSTDSIIMTGTGFSSTTAVTNSILWANVANFAGAISNAILIGGGTTNALTLTAFGARSTLLGGLGTSAPTVIGDDTLFIKSSNLVGNKPAVRTVTIGNGGLINQDMTTGKADLIYINASGTTGLSPTLDDRVIAIGTSIGAVQDATDCVVCSTNTSHSYALSTRCVAITQGGSNTNSGNTDCVVIGRNLSLPTSLRSVVFGRSATSITLTALTNATSMNTGTSAVNNPPDITMAGVVNMPNIDAAVTGFTVFGQNMLANLQNGTNSTLVGVGASTATGMTGVVSLGFAMSIATSSLNCVLIGNGLSTSVGNHDVMIMLGAGTITPTSNRLYLGTATNVINVTTTVGAGGAAAAPPAPAQYMRIIVNDVAYRVPLFNQA